MHQAPPTVVWLHSLNENCYNVTIMQESILALAYFLDAVAVLVSHPLLVSYSSVQQVREFSQSPALISESGCRAVHRWRSCEGTSHRAHRRIDVKCLWCITVVTLTSFDQPDGALSGRHAVHVSLWSDAHACSHWFPGLLQNLHSPNGLFNMLKVLR